MAVNIALLPILYVREMRSIGVFNSAVLAFTFCSFGIIIFVCCKILSQSFAQTETEFKIKLTADDWNYKLWDWGALPVFCATMMNIFEGNQNILNLYASAQNPGRFYKLVSSLFLVVSVAIGILVGILGYFAFGNSCQSTILLNMPSESNLGVMAKVCYVITILGSYVILVQPIFHLIEFSGMFREFLEPEPEPQEVNTSRDHFDVGSDNS